MKKLLQNPIIKGVLKSVPILGDVMTNSENENGQKKGKIDPTELVQALIRLIIVIAILKGLVSTDEAENIMDAIK